MSKVEFVNAVLDFAEDCLGEQEKKGNQGFKNVEFENLMKQVGHLPGEAWCALFAELCWSAPAYPGKSLYFSSMQDLFSKGAVQTFHNFNKDKSGLFQVDRIPERGAVVIWQNYRDGQPHWTGHAGIVKDVEGDQVICIEGNTNNDGGREGEVVAIKHRPLDFKPKHRGLVLKGFIKMKNYGL